MSEPIRADRLIHKPIPARNSPPVEAAFPKRGSLIKKWLGKNLGISLVTKIKARGRSDSGRASAYFSR
jgi:hypothetical protein